MNLRRATYTGLALFVLVISGCKAGPDYERPTLATPGDFRGAGAGTAKPRTALAEQSWRTVFKEPALRALIEVGLRENLDLAIASKRVMQAKAQLGITESALYPSVQAQASSSRQRGRAGGRGEPVTHDLHQLGAALSWELDFWGKLRRANEASRAQVLESVWAQHAVATSLVSQLASLYYELCALDQQLDVATRTLASREASLHYTQVREKSGAGSLVDVRQAEQLVYGARAQIASLRRLVTQRENAISSMLGHMPGAVDRAAPAPVQPGVAEVPTGLPSELLERRPDILQAEQALVAQNAQIGVAKAAYFPQINLTGSGGVASAALAGLFSMPALAWSAAGTLTQPLFNAGKLVSQVELAKLERDEAVLHYRQTVQQAFREVSDALVGYQRGRELRGEQQKVAEAAREARHLSDVRYQGGTTTYLEVLDSDTRLFVAELSLVQAELAERAAFVEIYRALGGGWAENPGS